MRYRTFSALCILGLGIVTALPVFSQDIPETLDIIATMLDAPKSGQNLKIVGANNTIHFVRTSYKLKNASTPVEVYVSHDTRSFTFGPSNISVSPQFRIATALPLEYRVLSGKPSYCLPRSDGLWFLFVFPDEPVDVAAFIERFIECWSFFEVRARTAAPEDVLPSLIGTLPGVR